MQRLMYSRSNVRSAVFAGYSEASVALAGRLKANPGICIAVDGFFDDRSPERLGMEEGARVLGRLSELADYVNVHKTEVIFVALPMRHVQRVLDLLDDLRDTTASIYYVPDVFVFDLIQSRTGEILGMPVVALCETPFSGYRGVVKRLTDVSLSLIGMLLLSPLFVAISHGGEAELAGAGDLQAAALRPRRQGDPGLQVPHDDRDRGRRRPIRQATRDDSRVTPVGAYCAATRSTSCPSS